MKRWRDAGTPSLSCLPASVPADFSSRRRPGSSYVIDPLAPFRCARPGASKNTKTSNSPALLGSQSRAAAGCSTCDHEISSASESNSRFSPSRSYACPFVMSATLMAPVPPCGFGRGVAAAAGAGAWASATHVPPACPHQRMQASNDDGSERLVMSNTPLLRTLRSRRTYGSLMTRQAVGVIAEDAPTGVSESDAKCSPGAASRTLKAES